MLRVLAKGELLSPRIYTASPPLYPTTSIVAALSSADGAAAFVKNVKDGHYDFIKMYGIEGIVFDSVVAAAHRAGVPFSGHTPEMPDGLERAIAAGYGSVEHLRGFPEYLTGGKTEFPPAADVDLAKVRAIAAKMKQVTPYEALETGTRNIAKFFGKLESEGTLAVGKRADMVLLPGNPLKDIRYTAHPAGVMIAGRWLDRAELDSKLKELEGVME